MTLWLLLPLVALSLPLWSWPIADYTPLYLVVGSYVACFWVGCFLASAFFEATTTPAEVPFTPAARQVETIILSVAAAMNVATLFARAAFNPFTCADLLACSNDAYQAYVQGQTVGSEAGFEYVRIALSPLIYGSLALSLWGRERAGPDTTRLLRWIVIGSELMVAVATGTSRNIGNVILFAIFIGVVRRRASGLAAPRRRPWTYIGVAIFLIAFLAYFASTQLNRDGAVAAVGLQPFGRGYIEALSYRIDSDSVLLKAAESIVRYLASGYFCLAVAIELPAGLTFPFGSSTFLARRAVTATGDANYVTLSLPGQVESLYGWSYTQQWQSLFSWLLSDYGYIITGLIMVGVGFFFISTLGVALTQSGIWSKLGIILGFIMVIFIPANNQIFQSPETYVAFIFAAIMLFFSLIKRVSFENRR